MRFGVIFPGYGPYCDRGFTERIAVEAERMGADAVLVWDHYMLPYGNETFDAYLLLSYLAARTSRIKLGTCVTPFPFRNPAMLAKQIATLDVLSQGRVIVGVGAGWHWPEFDAYSMWDGASVRVKKTKEALELMTRLWTETKVSFEGKFYSTKEAVLEPKPVQKPYPPLWFGTTGKTMLDLATKYGSGWIPTDITLGEYEKYASMLRSRLPSGKEKRFAFAVQDWPRGDLAARIEAYERAGCNFYCAVLHQNEKKALEQLKQLERILKE